MIYKSIHRLLVWGIFHALNTTIETNESEFDAHFDLLRTYRQKILSLRANAIGKQLFLCVTKCGSPKTA